MHCVIVCISPSRDRPRAHRTPTTPIQFRPLRALAWRRLHSSCSHCSHPPRHPLRSRPRHHPTRRHYCSCLHPIRRLLHPPPHHRRGLSHPQTCPRCAAGRLMRTLATVRAPRCDRCANAPNSKPNINNKSSSICNSDSCNRMTLLTWIRQQTRAVPSRRHPKAAAKVAKAAKAAAARVTTVPEVPANVTQDRTVGSSPSQVRAQPPAADEPMILMILMKRTTKTKKNVMMMMLTKRTTTTTTM